MSKRLPLQFSSHKVSYFVNASVPYSNQAARRGDDVIADPKMDSTEVDGVGSHIEDGHRAEVGGDAEGQ